MVPDPRQERAVALRRKLAELAAETLATEEALADLETDAPLPLTGAAAAARQKSSRTPAENRWANRNAHLVGVPSPIRPI